jgi:hypothetical protein
MCHASAATPRTAEPLDRSAQNARAARLLRTFRTIHRTTGAALFILFFLVSVTGLLLGWKKNSGGLIQAPTFKGTSTDLTEWQPLGVLQARAEEALREHAGPDMSLKLDRIDVRPDKGMAKFVFAEKYWGVQVDGATGNILHVERRGSDLVENIHDGSILDAAFGTDGIIKLIYTTVSGAALLMFTVTGFWLWLGPKRMRAEKRARHAAGGAVDAPSPRRGA